jgi:hypothetical protein
MNKNPFLNGLAATLYIILVVTVMTFGMKLVPHPNPFITPLAVLSLFTLSAAVMGYIFCLQPLQMYLDGHKKAAVNLFLQTVAVFAGITTLIFLIMISGIFPGSGK